MAEPFQQPPQLRLWQETVCSMRPVIDRILREYEEACQRVSNTYQKAIHRLLADSLRAKFERENGTCEGFWYYKAQQQNSGDLLMKKMERTYHFVDKYRVFEIHVRRLETDCGNQRSLRTAGETCKRILALQSEESMQLIPAELDNQCIHPLAIDLTHSPVQYISAPVRQVSISSNISGTKHVCLGRNSVRKAQPRLMSSRGRLKTRSSLNMSLHPPMLDMESTTFSQKRYANYCERLHPPCQSLYRSPHQSFP